MSWLHPSLVPCHQSLVAMQETPSPPSRGMKKREQQMKVYLSLGYAVSPHYLSSDTGKFRPGQEDLSLALHRTAEKGKNQILTQQGPKEERPT